MDHIKQNPHLHRPPKPEALEVPDPLYIRMPRSPERCIHSGLARTTLDILVRPQKLNDFNPPVRSKLLHQTSDNARIRLIEYASLKEYLHSLPDGIRRVRTLKPRTRSPKAVKEATP
jgi:hypothetical protein